MSTITDLIREQTASSSPVSIKYDTLFNLAPNSSAQSTGSLPGLEAVGCTCNPFGIYLGRSKQIFDFDQSENWKNVTAKPGCKVPVEVTAQNIAENYQRDTSGSTKEEYQESLSVKAKVKGNNLCWSGSAEVDCDKSSSGTSSRSYCTVRNNITLWTLKLSASRTRLRELLLADFRNDLDSLTPGDSLGPRERESISQFFDKYGSHFINGVRMGASAYMTSSIESSYCTSNFDLHAEARLSYNGLINKGSAEASANYSTNQKTFRQHAECTCITVGGDATKGGSLAFNGGYQAWVATVEQRPDLIDFMDDNSLTPIWDLCETEEKGKLLEEHFLNYWSDAASYLTSFEFLFADSYAQKADSQLTKIEPELASNPTFGKPASKNKWQYIHLCGAFTKPNCTGESVDCVTDIKVTGNNKETGKPEVPAGFTLIPQDFGTAMELSRYICVKLEPYDAAKAIRRLKIVKKENGQRPYQYSGPIPLGGEIASKKTMTWPVQGENRGEILFDGQYVSEKQTADLYFWSRPHVA